MNCWKAVRRVEKTICILLSSTQTNIKIFDLSSYLCLVVCLSFLARFLFRGGSR